MLIDLRPSKSSKLVPFQACSQQALDSFEFTNTRSGLSEDGSMIWLYKGAILEVVSTSSGLTVACLDAQHWLREDDVVVTCVCELPSQSRGPSHLLASLGRGSVEPGMVLVLNVATGLVVKALVIPQQVTVVETVLASWGVSVPSWAFSEQLRQFFGIVAVGTEGGYVYLIDLALDSQSPSRVVEGIHKLIPCPLLLLDPRERDIMTARQHALTAGQHLALRLGVDEQTHSNDRFHFCGPDLTVRHSFNEDEVFVSSLKYIPQLGTLAIGYSFGGFHLWKLFNPVIEFASSVEEEDLPVAFFVYQEPENDPKNFAYLWVCRDDRISDQKQESICSLSLYQLSFTRRTFYANYGNFFEELNMVVLRFDHNLTMEPYSSRVHTNTTTWSSMLLSAFIINHSHHNHLQSMGITIGDSFDDGYQSPDLSLCMFVWEAQGSRPGSRSEVFLAIFDMNRWYHAQMPSRIKCVNVGGQEVCPFLAIYHMNDAVYQEGCHSLVDIRMKPGSLLHFVNHSPMPPEQHFYPSSLAFDALCVMSNGIVTVSVLGVQRQVLASLESSGPLCLLKPLDLYHRCLQTGLMARSSDASSSSSLTVEELQRMCLLTLALEQGLIRFISACIRSWADGDYTQQGCTLQFILSWAWSRVTAIKQQMDLTCQPLFDWSGAPVDQRMQQVLLNSLSDLAHLRTVLHTLLTQPSPVSTQGQLELEYRICVVTLLHSYLKVMLWFIHSGLLPEHGDTGKSSSSKHYVYPATELAQVFADRRRHMQLPSASKTQEMILIDALVQSAGDSLSRLWRNEEGTGMYPPPSLHAVLSMYLLEDVDDNTKNAIMLYLLFDLAAVAHGQQEEFAEKIPRFARSFDLPLGLVHQIHGFWLIDHMNFREGLNQLCKKSGQDLGTWQHACILRALMHQGEASAALRYLTMRNPPVLSADDLRMKLTILVANRQVNRAMTYVHNSCGPGDQDLMLRHIFTQCQQQKLMGLLLKLPLMGKEEQCLQSFLSDNADPAAAEILVLHLLQRADYVAAIHLNDRIKHRATLDLSSKVRERSKTTNNIVEGFRRTLPAIQQYLISNPPGSAKSHITKKNEVHHPKPLSTVLTQNAERRTKSKSAMILAVMDKVAEAGKLLAEEEGLDEDEEDERMEEDRFETASRRLSLLMEKKKDDVDRDPVMVNKPGPFLCTPTTSRHLAHRHSLRGHVVFPSIKETTMTVTQALLSSASTLQLSPTTKMQSQLFTADCLTLLQTPKIDHIPARVVTPCEGIKTLTPHSILKMSRLPQSSPRGIRGSNSKSPRGQPRYLGFSLTSPVSPYPLPSTPTTTPSSTPSSTPSPTAAAATEPNFKAVAAEAGQSTKENSASEVVTPKHLRFAEPEVLEISPTYGSPDILTRPPLRSPPDEKLRRGQDSSQQESFSGQAIPVSDEEITFNMSRQAADLLETQNEEDASTLPITTPSPTARKTLQTSLHVLPSPPPQESAAPPETEEDEDVPSQSKQSILHEESSRSRLLRPSLHDKDSEKVSELTSFHRDRSPLLVRSNVKTETRSVRTTIRSEMRSERQRLSAAGGSTSVSFSGSTVSQQVSLTHSSVVESSWKQTSFVKETTTNENEHMSVSSEGMPEQLQARIASEEMVDSTQQTMDVAVDKDTQDKIMVVECDRESEATPTAESAEAMETIEPEEDSMLVEARQQTGTAAAVREKILVEEQESTDMVEVATDEDDLDLEVRVPTPLKCSSQRSTPERATQSRRPSATRQTGWKIDLGDIEDKETPSPTPPKLRRMSSAGEHTPSGETEVRVPTPIKCSSQRSTPERATQSRRPSATRQTRWKIDLGGIEDKETPSPSSPKLRCMPSAGEHTPSGETEWTETLPPLLLEISDDSNEKNPQPSSSLPSKADLSSQALLSRETAQRGLLPPQTIAQISVEHSPRIPKTKSPPTSPLLRESSDYSNSRRVTRSMDRSPPVSPLRRSTRSAYHSPPVSPSTRSAERFSPVSPLRRSTRSADRSPPVSPLRRSTRSADRSPLRSTRSVDRSPPVSPLRRSTRSVDRSPPVSRLRSTRSVDRSPPVSPLRRSTRSVNRSPPVSPLRRSTRSVDRSPPVSPLRRSTRRVDRSPPVSPLRRSTRSVDRSPPVSPLRSARRVDRSPPASALRSTKSMDRSLPLSMSQVSSQKGGEHGKIAEKLLLVTEEPLTVEIETSNSKKMPPPASPPRRSTRLRTPERSPGRKASTPERSPGRKARTPERTITKTSDTETQSSEESSKPVSNTVDIDDNLTSRSPSRRSQRSKTPDVTRLPPSVQETAAASLPEQTSNTEKRQPSSRKAREVLDVLPDSPSRQSQRSKTPDVTKQPSVAKITAAASLNEETSDAERDLSSSRTAIKNTDILQSPPQRSKAPDINKPALNEQETVTASFPEQNTDIEKSQSSSKKTTKDTDTPKSPGRHSRSPSQMPDPVAVPKTMTPSGQKSKAVKKSASFISPSRSRKGEKELPAKQASPVPTEIYVEASPSLSPLLRLRRGRSKTPEPSPARVSTRLRKSADRAESIPEEVKDIAVATEEVRTQRRQQRDSSPRTTGTVSSHIHETDSEFAAPSDESEFIFSHPITRVTRSQRGSESSSASTTISAHSRGKKGSEIADQSASGQQQQPETSAKTKKTGAKSVKMTKTKAATGFSPSDSPIALVSPGQPESSEIQPSPATVKHSTLLQQSARSSQSLVLRKRKAKLW